MAHTSDMTLNAWLQRVEADERWSAPVDGVGNVTAYIINCQLVMVLRYTEKVAGWELLIPASNKNDTELTIDAAAVALGVNGCRGL